MLCGAYHRTLFASKEAEMGDSDRTAEGSTPT